ncbi:MULTISPECIES: FecR family protein [unclassified Imperialibacter]|uniref:FecR family protein n=1 Tax=unclassified Imperialibacter TaxID=2629706 RepID=UPI001255B7C8|nr:MULTISPECIES: FecR domain-containing protein [unclassified Imperialibacter]CAD5281102.1 putative FecR family protein [Imperialibacter sp. 75]CAD5296408.1 putative FecR family protein [Imperialibacter sp. 89]VVT27724.1 putative FecR family protein [Imperialibacter sp. EC-SDR9]
MIELLAKYLSGNASLEEQQQVEEWRNENQEEFLSFSEAWSATDVKSFDVEKARGSVMGRISTQKNFAQVREPASGFSGKIWAVAASIVVLLGIGYFLFVGSGANTSDEITVDGWVVVETDAGESKDVKLSDGSVVAMSEMSRLSYPTQFADERRVVFNGKAFFDITPDPDHAFKVETIEALVTVVGTSFQVKTESEAKYSEVIVETGVVSLTKKPQPNVAERPIKVELFPGETGVVRREGQGVSKSKNMNQNYLAWKTNKMVFKQTSMKEVVNTLNEVYKADIRLANKDIGDCRLTATFDGKPISEVMEVISQTFSFEVTGSKNKYEIDGKACR